ncbi:glycosyltransferase family 2 protein [Flavihumibacter profundi]|uniref:glycosyltransferase family 2 protein n=1 Tax=Flavihumibacter profundi TaxID=2716883 RepID=UPI001CC532D2|nr:glycosyltransferase family 2 protein [Flavihumibacter profundi]MBZ5859150.1 glycosyltransferase family 2 protein [Flavihumibacter profundi]
MKKFSILIPCYNEEKLIARVLDNIIAVKLDHDLEKEIIVVDDGSTDGTQIAITAYLEKNPGAPVTSIRHAKNAGKGAAVQTALAAASGEIVIIQDSDLEYSPKDYNKLLQPVIDGHADVVYGSRFIGAGPHRVLFFFHTIGNKFLTFLSNLFSQLNLTDMETGYKLFRADMLKQISLKEKGFGFEPEVTAKISRIKQIRIYEVGIAYYGRTYDEGKKIKWTDGVYTIYCIFKYNIFPK